MRELIPHTKKPDEEISRTQQEAIQHKRENQAVQGMAAKAIPTKADDRPPFKLFILLAAISLFVTHGFNIKGINYSSEEDEQMKTVAMEKSNSNTEIINELETAKDSTASVIHVNDSLNLADQLPGQESQQQANNPQKYKHLTENQYLEIKIYPKKYMISLSISQDSVGCAPYLDSS